MVSKRYPRRQPNRVQEPRGRAAGHPLSGRAVPADPDVCTALYEALVEVQRAGLGTVTRFGLVAWPGCEDEARDLLVSLLADRLTLPTAT